MVNQFYLAKMAHVTNSLFLLGNSAWSQAEGDNNNFSNKRVDVDEIKKV